MAIELPVTVFTCPPPALPAASNLPAAITTLLVPLLIMLLLLKLPLPSVVSVTSALAFWVIVAPLVEVIAEVEVAPPIALILIAPAVLALVTAALAEPKFTLLLVDWMVVEPPFELLFNLPMKYTPAPLTPEPEMLIASVPVPLALIVPCILRPVAEDVPFTITLPAVILAAELIVTPLPPTLCPVILTSPPPLAVIACGRVDVFWSILTPSPVPAVAVPSIVILFPSLLVIAAIPVTTP